MKSIILGLLIGFVASVAVAAEGEWLTDLPKAQAKAKTEKKLVLADFTGSDWCPPCKALHKNVLSDPEFKKYAKDNLILVEIDFPKRKKQDPELERTNRALAEKFQVEAFPTVIVFDSAGKEVKRESGYGGETAADYIAKLKKLQKS
jgi:protein disulfide-isomerase